jgi:glucosamine-6-phosphate deaminase
MSSTSIPIIRLKDSDSVGEFVAQKIATAIREAGSKPLVLGFPSGRTPRPTIRALAQIASIESLDLSQVHILLMDDYVWQEPNGRFKNVSLTEHFSCRKFAQDELLTLINAKLDKSKQIKLENLHAPDAANPMDYETLIDALGGIDIFILASGSSDGHVAFNGPGAARLSLTSVMALAEETRSDNLLTFPDFKSIEEVPRFGVSVGISTIADKSRLAIMILTSKEKREAFQTISSARKYDPAWPATVVVECREGMIVVDELAG